MKASKLKFSYQEKVDISNSPKICSSKDAYNCFTTIFSDSEIERRELCVALYLNRNNVVKGSSIISIGGQAGTVVDPKILFQEALVVNAAAIVLAHNHPSGNLALSDSDQSITDKLVACGKILDLPLIDHLILTKKGYLSMADEGLI